MKYDNLFRKGKIGSLEIKNRVVMPPMGTQMSSAIGEVTDHLVSYYGERARGGVGLIISEVFAVDFETGRSGPSNPRTDQAGYTVMIKRLADTIHQFGAKFIVQLQHPGCQTTSNYNNGNQLISPSGVQSTVMPDAPRALSNQEVKEMVGKFITGAVNCKAAGVDGIEIHGAHGYLVSEFISPHFNKRTDEYGGSFENRMRFAKEIIEGIRTSCGADFPIVIRLNLDEFLEDGISLEEGIKVAMYMEALGVDAIDVSCATYDTMYFTIEPISFEQGWRAYMAEAVKQAVKIPVIAVGVIREPQVAENLLKEGKADFIAVGRGHLADPEWCNKAKAGREGEIRKCISCLTCFEGILAGHHVACAVNARTGSEWQYGALEQSGNGRKVVVVGGGPSGIEAARVLAERGFQVVLFEQRSELGGQLNYGSKPLGKSKINWFTEYGQNELKRLNVTVRMNTKADASSIKNEEPYAVFIATGGNPMVPPIKGIESGAVYTAEEVLKGSVPIKDEKVVVIGGGMTGCETAALIASWGNQVSVVEMLPNICTGAMFLNIIDVSKSLEEHQVAVYNHTRLEEIGNGAIRVKNLETSETEDIKADKVVLALGVRSENSLYNEIEEQFERAYLIGDAFKVRKIVNAVKDGYIAAANLR